MTVDNLLLITADENPTFYVEMAKYIDFSSDSEIELWILVVRARIYVYVIFVCQFTGCCIGLCLFLTQFAGLLRTSDCDH